jgi:hypothetical protein
MRDIGDPRAPRVARRVAATLVVVAGAAACATPPLRPGEPRSVERLVIAPYAMHTLCAPLSEGDRLDYRFQSSAPVDFDIRYHDGPAVVSPVVRDQASADSGTFKAAIREAYCLAWEAGAPGAILDYRVMLRPAAH